MPFTAADIVATPGAPDANSYVTLAEFVAASASESVSVVVEDALDDEIARALVSSAEMLDDEHYIGQRATDSQARAWPRVGATDVYGFTYSDTEVPRRLKRAQVLHARSILERVATGEGADPTTPDADGRISRVKAGDVEVAFNAPTAGNPSAATPLGGALPDSVLRALSGIVLTPAQAAALLSPAQVGSFAWVR